eukprot:CAMPEP_0202750438 /NCGR_PEP_ID=MMETSP1388-20130828/11312_1 /ASSEMBLY_ACC=CAM_ASM_000864 /TAXON_ID=37098 /ORGANISM="Isochrysis sp, Strain CCMP1244" /LENGTH=102 /DNA_ID=CAMNT_0049418015 /DNA_START=16 /DNA_END=322 /DNA_ORIENTATION=+
MAAAGAGPPRLMWRDVALQPCAVQQRYAAASHRIYALDVEERSPRSGLLGGIPSAVAATLPGSFARSRAAVIGRIALSPDRDSLARLACTQASTTPSLSGTE